MRYVEVLIMSQLWVKSMYKVHPSPSPHFACHSARKLKTRQTLSPVMNVWVFCLKNSYYIYGYGSIPINTIFRGMNIHLPTILMFTRGTRFLHTTIWNIVDASRCTFPIAVEAIVALWCAAGGSGQRRQLVVDGKKDGLKWVWVKIRYPNNWMVNTKLDIHICGPLGLPFWPTSKW